MACRSKSKARARPNNSFKADGFAAALTPTLGMKMIRKILRVLLGLKKPTSTDEIALRNYSLALAQEWGEYWLKPIQERLSKAYPHLTHEQLESYNSISQAAMKHGHDLVYSMAEQKGKGLNFLQWRAAYASDYPWVDEKNLKHLFSTGSYYAWKDGVA